MNPTFNIDKPKLAEVEKVKCSCCIRQVFNEWIKKTTSFVRSITPFKIF